MDIPKRRCLTTRTTTPRVVEIDHDIPIKKHNPRPHCSYGRAHLRLSILAPTASFLLYSTDQPGERRGVKSELKRKLAEKHTQAQLRIPNTAILGMTAGLEEDSVDGILIPVDAEVICGAGVGEISAFAPHNR